MVMWWIAGLVEVFSLKGWVKGGILSSWLWFQAYKNVEIVALLDAREDTPLRKVQLRQYKDTVQKTMEEEQRNWKMCSLESWDTFGQMV